MDSKMFAGAAVAEAPAKNSDTDERTSTTSEQRRRELADFLRTRREKLKPEQVGITQVSRRRTPGLRREEVAELAGVGTTWYTWLEQARDIQPSSEVLRRLGQALQMNPAEIRHLFALAGKAAPLDLDNVSETIPASLDRVVHQALQVPALVFGQRWDILSMNQYAKDVLPGICELPQEKRNWLYYIFCMQGPRQHLKDWESNARRLIGQFRASLSESLDDPWVLELVDMLKVESPEFAQWWREHDVRDNGSAVVEFTHPSKGPLLAERSILRTPENPRLKVLLLTPLS